MADRHDECPLARAGLRLVELDELPPMLIDRDGCCICTKTSRCVDVDKKGDQRCTLHELKILSQQATRRRAWQSGE